MHSHAEVVSVVNEVVETLNERVEGYTRAADHVKDPTIESIFREYALRTKDYISELQPFSDSMPHAIGKGPLGTIYQGWMSLKEKITGYNTNSILGDCIFGEEAAKKVYETAINDADLPQDLRTVLKSHLSEIVSAQDRLKILRNQFE